MAITLVGVGAQEAGFYSGVNFTITGAWPAGYTAVAGDVAVVIATGRSSTDGVYPAAPTPATYTLVAQSLFNITGGGSRDIQISVWIKVLTASESAPSITEGTNYSSGLTIQTAVFRGVDTSTPQDATAVTSSSAAAATWAPTGITTATAGAWVLSCVASADDNALGLNSGGEQGFTAQMSGASYDTTLGDDMAMGLAVKEISSPGAVTCPTWKETVNGNDAWAAVTLALRPITTVTVSSSDTGSGADAGTLVVHVGSSDTASGSDASATAAALIAADTGSGLDAWVLAAWTSSTDTGSGVDTGSLRALLAVSDTAGGMDAWTVVAALAGSDTGSGADAGSLLVFLSVADDDFGTGLDGAGWPMAVLLVSDTGLGVSAMAALAATLSDDEESSGSDGILRPVDGGEDISFSADLVTDRGIGQPDEASGLDGESLVYLVRAVTSADTAVGLELHYVGKVKRGTLLSTGLSGKPGGDGRRLGGDAR